MTKLDLNAIAVSTRIYQRNLGKAPRGFGMWAFSIGNTEGYDDVSKAFFTPTAMTYAQAVRTAKMEAIAKGVDTIYVLP